MHTVPDGIAVTEPGQLRLPAPPFRGALPTIRFATGSVFVVVGLAAITGLSTGNYWLAGGATHWVPMDMVSASVFMLLGAIMMISRSNLARETSWVLMLAIGAVPFIQYFASDASGIVEPGGGLAGPWLRALPAFLFILTGLRIYAATRAPILAPLLDGVILGLSLPALLGYLSGFAPLYDSSVFGGISALEALGFSMLGVLFLLADLEYARLDMRAWKLSAAIGVSALAATTSLRVTEAMLDSFGRSGLQGMVAGRFTPEVGALATTNLLMALSIGAAAMLLLISRDNTQIARREAEGRRQSRGDFARTSDQLGSAFDELARLAAGLAEDIVRPAMRLGASADRLREELASGRTGPAAESACEIAHEARGLVLRAEILRLDDRPPPADFNPEIVDFAEIIAGVVAQNRTTMRGRRNRVLTEHAGGAIEADRTRLQQALHLMLGHALEATHDCTPLISVRLDLTGEAAMIRMSFSSGGECSGTPQPAFALVRRIAAWHGGDFRTTVVGRSQIMELTLGRRG